MGLIASLDIGTETMVMALGREENHAIYLEGIKFQASQGVERGVVTDWKKVEAGIHILKKELLKDREIDVLNVCLSGAVLHISEQQIRMNLQKRIVEAGDIIRARQRCIDVLKEEEWVDVLPVAYAVDQGEWLGNPLGKRGRELEAIYQIYQADSDYLSKLRRLFENLGIEEVCFYPAVQSYKEMLPIAEMKELALVDIGAMGIQVALFRDGLLTHEAYLPLGSRTIDHDIMYAYGVNSGQARKLKHEHGEALRLNCKNKKVQIPDTNLTLESRDLAMVVQSRAEELLEGVVCLLQNWGYEYAEDKIFLTGGGSRLKNMDVLLNRLSGHPVEKVVARHIQTSRGDVLRTPEYIIALGLLMYTPDEMEKKSLWDQLMDKFKVFFD